MYLPFLLQLQIANLVELNTSTGMKSYLGLPLMEL